MDGLLSDCLILDLSRLLPGPYGSMILADHGARVIVIESRRFEKDGISFNNSVNRNKEHMTLDLKTDSGKDIFYQLVRKADVVMEGFRPGVMSRLKAGYDDLKQINPKIIYCSITGYGQSGPLKHQAGHDINYLGHSGVLSLIGQKDGPPSIPGIQVADIVGGLYCAIGILLAIQARTKTQKGRHIDISMTDAMSSMLPYAAGWLWQQQTVPQRSDSLLSHRFACYNIYRTKDDRFITVGALEGRFWESLCRHFLIPEYIPLQFDETRKEEITAFFKRTFLKKTRDEWMEIFHDQDVCIGGVLDVKEALESDLSKERESVVHTDDSESSRVLGIPIKFSEGQGSIRSRPFQFGEHTESILTELGFTAKEIFEMARRQII